MHEIPTTTLTVDRHLMRYVIPSSIFRQTEFDWKPVDLDAKQTAAKQFESLESWVTHPFGPKTFVVTGPEQLKAEYAAARLVQYHVSQNPHNEVMWLPLYDSSLDRYTGAFPQAVPKKKRDSEPTLIVVTNLELPPKLHFGKLMTWRIKAEQVRDIQAKWPSIPIIICGYGCTPLELAEAIPTPVHGLIFINPNNEVKSV